MTRQDIEEKVKFFLIEDLEIDEDKITPDAKLKDYIEKNMTGKDVTESND